MGPETKPTLALSEQLDHICKETCYEEWSRKNKELPFQGLSPNSPPSSGIQIVTKRSFDSLYIKTKTFGIKGKFCYDSKELLRQHLPNTADPTTTPEALQAHAYPQHTQSQPRTLTQPPCMCTASSKYITPTLFSGGARGGQTFRYPCEHRSTPANIWHSYSQPPISRTKWVP